MGIQPTSYLGVFSDLLSTILNWVLDVCSRYKIKVVIKK